MSLWLLIVALIVVGDLLVVVVVLGLATAASRADRRAQREMETWSEHAPGPGGRRVRAPDTDATPYPDQGERPGQSGSRAAGARPGTQR
jgi:hypothetical protein